MRGAPEPSLPDVVVLSPHFDDAVLSVGALLARLVAAGRRVQVCTVFTAGPAPAGLPRRWRAFADYDTRQGEDDRALAVLGASSHRLGLQEWVWRASGGPGWLTAFRGPRAVADLVNVPVVGAALAAEFERPHVEVYAPLGVGQHADHVEVAVAAFTAAQAAGALRRVAFYEDFYALSETFRRQHPVTGRVRGAPFASPGWAGPGLGVTLRTLAALAADPARSPRPDRFVPSVRDVSWWPEAHDVGAFEQTKFSALAAYPSQVSRLGGRRGLVGALSRAHRLRGGEVLWRVRNGEASPE